MSEETGMSEACDDSVATGAAAGAAAGAGVTPALAVRRRRARQADATRCRCCGARQLRDPGTPQQVALLLLIAGMRADAGGVAPGYRALAARYGTKSLSTIHRIVGALAERGWLTRNGPRRSITVLQDPGGRWREPLLASRLPADARDALAVIAELTPTAFRGGALPTLADLARELDLAPEGDGGAEDGIARARALVAALARAGWAHPRPVGRDAGEAAVLLLRRPDAPAATDEDIALLPLDQRLRVNEAGNGSVVAFVRRPRSRREDKDDQPA
jgi:hypothetical protein